MNHGPCTHQKGFDSFSTVEYAEGIRWLRDALETGGWRNAGVATFC
ncbi:glutamine amidotransferase [Mesorhizobium sanjuanii]